MSPQWRSVMEALEAIAEFFDRLSQPRLGDYFREIATMIRLGRLEEAVQELTGARLWGGAGSYIDRVLYPEDGYVFAEEEFWQVNAKYSRLLLSLLYAVEAVAPREWMSELKARLQNCVQYYTQRGDA